MCVQTFKHEYLKTSWICEVRDDGEVSADDTLCAMLGVQEVTAAHRTRRLRWFGHVACSSLCINSITSMTIPNTKRRERPKKTWSECVKADMKMCSLGSIDPLNREAWGLGVRHSSHLLPTPVPGTAVEKLTPDQVKSAGRSKSNFIWSIIGLGVWTRSGQNSVVSMAKDSPASLCCVLKQEH